MTQDHNPEDVLIASVSDFQGIVAHLRRRRGELNARAGEAGGLELARAHSDLVDAVMRRALAISCARAGRPGAPDAAPVAVVATGGYGRRELSPFSDVDITFIPYRDGDPAVDRVIKEMFTLVMRVFIDASGIDVGYAYRLPEDCPTLDHQTVSGLLDARMVAGSPRIFIGFENEYWPTFNPAEFIFTKLDERRRQYGKSGAVPRVVEPNLKDGAGGLRDLHTAVWVTQALHRRTAAQVRGERMWALLANEGGVCEADVARLREAHEFALKVRGVLHVLVGSGRDQLVITRQEEVADRLGYAVGPAGGAPPVERFMRDHFRHAADVHRICTDVMQRVENASMELGIGLDCRRRDIEPAGAGLAHEDPVWMLWACEFAQKHGLGFGSDLRRIIAERIAEGAAIGDSAQAAEVFTRILRSPRGAWPTLQSMADLGILGWFIPPIGEVMDLIPYDPSHQYSVGQHTLFVVRHLDDLRELEGVDETRDYRLIMQELPHPEQLYLAALLHDAGKVTDERPHSETGAQIAADVCRALGWDDQATANVCALVRHHLLMAETSRLRDLHLDEVIREFTAAVSDLDVLHMLYLLTYADTSAVGDKVWTQVKGRFLRDLLHRSERALEADEPDEYDDAGLVRTRRRLLKELSVENLPPEEVARHVDSMPPTYLLNTELAVMALHIGFVRKARSGQPVVDFHDDRGSTFTEVTVCALDEPQPGLLSKIAGVFHAADLNVHSAQVFTRVSGEERIAIDTFLVDFRGRRLTSGKRRELLTNLTDVLTGRADVAEVLGKRSKSAAIGGEVERLEVHDDIAGGLTFVSVTSQHGQATLYRASGALSAVGWDIHSARVSLFHGRSVATFYVTGVPRAGKPGDRRALEALMPQSGGRQ